jgi:hypothetical protein
MVTQPNHKVGHLIWRAMIATALSLTVLWSGASRTTLVVLFSGYALADGLWVLIVRQYKRGDSGHREGVLLRGGAGIVIGGIGCIRPNVTALLPLIGAWAILIGGLDFVAALGLHNVSRRNRQIAWDATIWRQRQRQMARDGAMDRTVRYASAEKMAWDNKSDRVMRAERLGSGWRADA